MDKDKIEKFMAKRSVLLDKAADYLKERVIGDHVIALVSKHADVSLDALLQALKQTAERGPKADQLPAKAALAYLQSQCDGK